MKSDVEELMPRMLPVEFEAGAQDLDLNGPPRNPREYLRQVQWVHLEYIILRQWSLGVTAVCYAGAAAGKQCNNGG